MTSFGVGNHSGGGTGSTQSVMLPGTIGVGDLMLLTCAFDNTGPTTTKNPTGWTQLGVDVPSGNVTLRALTRKATSGDLGSVVSFTFTKPGGVANIKAMVCVATYPAASSFGTPVTSTSTGLTHSAPALSTIAATSWVANIYAERSSTNPSWAPSGSDTARVTGLGAGGGASSTLIADSNGAPGTSYAAQTATAGISSAAAMMSIEILSSGAIVAPGAPTAVSAVAGDSSAIVSGTAGSTGGGTVDYFATSSPGGFVSSKSLSPSGLAVGGLTNGTAYQFEITTENSAGSATSGLSTAVTPTAATLFFRVGAIPIIAGPAVTPPPPSTFIHGIAGSRSGETLQDTWNTIGVVPGRRSYDSGFPDKWSNSSGSAVDADPTVQWHSFKPGYAGGGTKAQATALTAFYKTLPAGLRLTPHHEPENDGVTPDVYAAMIWQCEDVLRSTRTDILFGPIWIANPKAASSDFADAYANLGGAPDFDGVDAYSFSPGFNSIKTAVSNHYTTNHTTYFPTAAMLVGEYGQDSKAGSRGSFLTTTNKDLKKLGFTGAYYYDDFNWVLGSDDLTTLAGLS